MKNNFKRLKRILSFAIMLVFVTPTLFAHVASAETLANYRKKQEELIGNRAKKELTRIVVKTKKDITKDEFDGINGIESDGDGNYVIQFDSVDDARYAEQMLRLSGDVEYVEADQIVTLDYTKDEMFFANKAQQHLSWGIDDIGADAFGEYVSKKTNDTIIVAVVDTGVQASHEYLQGRLLAGYDFCEDDSNPQDGNGHGTHVAGTIVDVTLKNTNVKIMPIRALDNRGQGYLSDIAQGIRYAVDHGASIINMSLGGNHSSVVDDAVQYAVNRGVICVVAAGNENEYIASNACPAHITDVITVGAIDSNMNRASFSNYGKLLDLVAPGVSINSSYPGNSYESLNGTSMAAPHVAGCVALIKLIHPEYTPEQMSEELTRSCDDLGRSGKDDYYGHGVVNLKHLLSNLPPEETCNHQLQYVSAKKADCQNSGMREYYFCNRCEMKFLDGSGLNKAENAYLYIEPLGHQYDAGTFLEKASPNSNGVVEYRCERSGCTHQKETRYISRIERIELDYEAYQYTGRKITPSVTVYDAQGNALSNKFYSVQYRDNVEVGAGEIVLDFYDLYTGRMTTDFEIEPRTLPKVQLKKSQMKYTGRKQTVSFVFEGSNLVKGQDYIVIEKSNGINVGAHDVVIIGCGNYKGFKNLTYYVTPAQAKIKAVSGKKKAISLTWEKQKGKCHFYEIECSTTNDFTDKICFDADGEKTSAILKDGNFKAKKYYVRVRSCTMIGGKRFYSSWSPVVQVKVKKR